MLTFLRKPFVAPVIALAAALTVSAAAYAAGGHGHDEKKSGHMMEKKGDHHGGGHHGGETGEPGKAADVSRTINVTMTDNLFTPEEISVKKGETIKFVITNKGEFLHEFNIGTAAMHATHQKEMAVMMEHGMIEPDKINHERMKMDMGGGHSMKHDDPNSVLLEPKKTGEIIWKFSTDAELEFACNVPGHYASGMMGDFKIQ